MSEEETHQVMTKLHDVGFTDEEIEKMDDEELELYIEAILDQNV